MKKIILTLLFSFLFHFQPAQANEYPHISQLQNGLTVLIKEDHRFPIVSTRLYVRSGSSNEKQDKLGIAHLLEHMLFKGTKTHPKGIDFIVENEGGDLNAYTSYDRTVYYNDMPSQKWRLSLEAIQGLAFEPILRRQQLNEEREVVIAELRQRGDMPETKLLHLSTSSTLHGTPYANPVIGTVETLKSITTQDIQEYIKAHIDKDDLFRSTGKSYIQLAQEEPHLFKIFILHHREGIASLNDLYESEANPHTAEIIAGELRISVAQARQLHLNMLIYTIGIGTIFSVTTPGISADEIYIQQESAFQAFLKQAADKTPALHDIQD